MASSTVASSRPAESSTLTACPLRGSSAPRVEGDAVAALERLFRRERAQPCTAILQAGNSLPHPAAGQGDQPLSQTVLRESARLDPLGPPLPASLQSPAALLPGSFALAQGLAGIALAQHSLQVGDPFAPPRVRIEGQPIEGLATPLQLV